MRRDVTILVILVAAFAVVLASTFFDSASRSSDDMEEPLYPSGISVDQSSDTVWYTSETEWHIMDLLKPYYVEERYDWVKYEGYTETGMSISLEPGMYHITTPSCEFDVVITGPIQRSMSWTYIMDGVPYEVSVSFSIDAEATAEQRTCGIKEGGTRQNFSALPGKVIVDDSIRGLTDVLEREYLRIGGSTSDRQSYADFLASFVQEAIPYPHRIAGHGEDYSLYGEDEYWARPLETLALMSGDCEDTSILICAIYTAAGYEAAVGGMHGHVFAGVALDDFEERSEEEREALDDIRTYGSSHHTPVEGFCAEYLKDTVFYAVETIYGQMYVGYLLSGNTYYGDNTLWGIGGFYTYHGAEPGIQPTG